MINQLISLKQTHVFLEYALPFFFSIISKNKLKTWMEKVIRFQIADVEPQALA